MMNLSKDLHRKGQMDKIKAMETLGNKLTKGKDIGLAYITEGFLGYDALAVIPNRPEYVKHEGFIVFDEDSNMAKFIKDGEEQ